MKHIEAKEFALGALTTMPKAAWNDPKTAAKMMVDAVAQAVKQMGTELTGEMVRGVAYSQQMVVVEMHRIADEMDGVDRTAGPQLAKPGTAPPPCVICKQPLGDGPCLVIHVDCAPRSGPARVRVKRKR